MTPRQGPTISKQEKLRHSRQFREVYVWGRRLSGPCLAISYFPNQLNVNRLGLLVSKKRFKLSVRRHAIMRRLREAYRLNKMRLLPGYDIIITALKFNKGKINFAGINKELLFLAQKAGLLKRVKI